MAETEVGEGVTKPVGDAADAVSKAASHKAGGLPVWVWIVGGIVVVAVGYFVILPLLSGGAGATGATTTPSVPDLSGGGGGGGGGPTGGAPTTSTPTLTNASWLTAGVQAAVAQLGVDTATATAWLEEYLAGGQPVGLSASNSSLFTKVINAATTANGGPPPQAPGVPSPGISPYSTFGQWLSAGLGILGSNAPPGNGLQQELANYFNGLTTSVSPSANRLYELIVGVLGAFPGNATSLPTSNTPPTTSGTGPTVVAADILKWQNTWFTGTNQTFNTWVQDAPAALTNTFTIAQLNSIFNYFENQARAGVNYQTGDLVTLINGWLANPSSAPQNVQPTQTGRAATSTRVASALARSNTKSS